MKKLLLMALTIAGLIIVLSGCRTAPIYNVNSYPISYEYGRSLQLSQISRAIFKAGNKLNWTMVQNRPNKITATYTAAPNQQYQAVIEIMFDKTRYSIEYVDSRNLQYDKKNKYINRNYNRWIVDLTNEINNNIGNEFAILPTKAKEVIPAATK